MHVRIPPPAPFAFLAIWAVTCVCAFLYARSPVVFQFSYFILPLSSLIVPFCFAHLACQIAIRKAKANSESKPSVAHSVVATAVGLVAYGLSESVVARFLELPWRAGKFGETSLDLGKSAAQFYAVVAILTALAAFALLRSAPAGSRPTRYAIGSLGMLASASFMYFLFGLTPLVQWRA